LPWLLNRMASSVPRGRSWRLIGIKMKCPECKYDNPVGNKFCGQCGGKLILPCLKCGCENHSGNKYCDACGSANKKSLDSPPVAYPELQSYTPKYMANEILNTRTAIEGERKSVTVLFADVADSTAMFEDIDPEDVHEIMNGCFEIMLDKIHSYEGTVNQFRGDGAMALFGAPLALEDHYRRACHSALEIQKAIKRYNGQLNKKYGIDLKMRIGLNSGPVVVGSIGNNLRMDYTADGDTTNLASRIESSAKPGAILVSENTYKQACQYFRFNTFGKIKVKGKTTPLEAYELVDTIERLKVDLDRQIVSELVGRKKELNTLELHVKKAINGEGSIVNIIGEAGIGKSRLVAEIKNREIMKQVTLLEGRAISIGRNFSFHPIIDLLKHWARIREDDSEATSINKLEIAIRQAYPKEMPDTLPFVATLMGMKLSGRIAERVKGIEGEALEKLILKNVRDLLITISIIRPLIIVIEDLQWADMSSIEMIESLLRLAGNQRILFVNVFRPGYNETSDRIVDTTKEKFPAYHVEIMLTPLDEKVSEKLIRKILNIKGLQQSVIDQIGDRAGGNPFFIEEVVRSFIDGGAVIAIGGGFEITDKINSIVIPRTINDVLMARIDRLEEKTRDLVKIASVIGRSFFYRIIIEVAQAIGDIDHRLFYLKEIQLIRDRSRKDEIEYLFKHALVQEAAYESILLQKRKEIHLNVAHTIEKVFKEKLHEFYSTLAYHYSKGEDHDKTEEYMIKAGEEALRSSASSEAIHYYQEALSLYLKKNAESTDANKIAFLEKNIAIALYNKGRYEESLISFYKVMEYQGVKYPSNLIGIFFNSISGLINLIIALYIPALKWNKIPTDKDNEILLLEGKKYNALMNIDPKKMLIELIGRSRILIDYDFMKSQLRTGYVAGFSIYFSWTAISFKLSRRILELVKDKIMENDFQSKFYYEQSRLVYDFQIGEWGNINDYDDDLFSLVSRGAVARRLIPYLVHFGLFYTEKGQFQTAIKMNNKIEELAFEYENDFFLAMKYSTNALVLFKCRRLDDAMIEAQEGIAFTTKRRIDSSSFYLLVCVSAINAISGDVNKAKNQLNDANEIISALRLPPFYVCAYYIFSLYIGLIQLEKSLKNKDNAEIKIMKKKVLRDGKKSVVKSKKSASFRTEAYRFMGTYYWLCENQSKALKWWILSVREGKRLGAKLELSRTYFEVAKRLLEEKSKYHSLNGISAKEYLKKAKTMFQEMDLQWDLNELDKTLSDGHI